MGMISLNGIYGMSTGSDQLHCGLMLASRITFAHFAVSFATNFAKVAGELANGAPPSSARRAFILGSARAAFISAFNLLTISDGVLLGAAKPYQVLAT
jgi:hypothetical protein